MAKTKEEKKILLNQYRVKIQNSKGFVVVKPTKLLPTETNEFKKELYDQGSQFNVVKNSIFKIALKEENLPEIESFNAGEHAILFLGEDIVSPSKSLKKFIDSTKYKNGDLKVEIVSGMLDKSLLTKEQVKDLADMPDIRGSIALILGILDNAISGVVNVLEDAPRAYVSILDQAFKE